MNHLSRQFNKLMASTLQEALAFFILLCCCLILNIPPAFAQESSDSANEKLDQVKKAIKQQRSAINQVDKKRQRLVEQLKANELAIAKISKALNQTKHSLISNKEELAQLKQQHKKLTTDKKKQESILAKQLRAAYSAGHHDYLKLILNQQEPSSIQRTVTYYQYLNNARIQEIDQYKATITELIDVTTKQQEKTKQLQQLNQQQSQQKQSLEQSNKKRQQTVAQLNRQLLNSKERLQQLEAQEANLQEALARIAKLSKQEINLTGLGKLKRKLAWPVKGKINRSFGSRKQGYLKWKGVLMAAPVGRQVKTIHNGTVLFSDWLKGYGLVTVIDHGAGYMSLYGHNQALLKSVGDRVETGEPIALVGQSGGQIQSALYFEIRHNGQAVNPKLWCR